MNPKPLALTAIVLLCLVALSGLASAQALLLAAPLGAGFTYQGQLIKASEPYSGDCAMTFRLYDALAGGTQIAGDQVAPTVPVTRGLFTVALDFGSGAFPGDRRWLEVEVACPPDGDRGLITPRQELTAAPYAGYAAGNWGLDGNSGTTASTNYLGTRDDQALELKVWGARALRIEPVGTNSPNLIGGYPTNEVQAGAHGATIAGGGLSGEPNVVTDNYGAVGGGVKNRAGDSSGDTSDKSFATVGGGYSNTASGIAATVGGGASTPPAGATQL